MKKVFLSALVCLASSIAISCGSNSSSQTSNNAKVDTLSYIVGMDMGSRIEMDIIPMFKVDYITMMSIFEQALDPNATINIEGEQFNMENYREIGDKYITKSDLRTRVMAAQNDSTAQIYKDEKEKKIVSAILGADFAYSVSNLNMGLDNVTLKKAILDVHEGKKLFTDEFAMEYTRNYFTVVIPQQNKKESEKWLAEIVKQEGVKKTASGILYKIENAGDASIKATKDQDVVKVLYTGRTKDGKVFDSNRWNDMPSNRQEMIKTYQPDQAEKNNPIEFPLDRVIKGWTEGMKLIGKGGRIILWIPSSLAYGERGTGQDIGPNEALCFDVELLDVTSK
jgi:FKBP-type peptidyl-prolyl cis-trans isomerase FkpA